MKICIDDGSTNIKLAWTENGERRNAISPNSFKSEWSAPFGGMQPANYMLDGVRYGFDPVSDRFVQTTDTQYQYSDVNVIAIHHALVKSGITPQEVDVVVTLPLSEYFETNAQPDMANINRKKANVMRSVEYQNGEAFTIRNVRVMPESIPAGFKALADMSRNGLRRSVARSLRTTCLMACAMVLIRSAIALSRRPTRNTSTAM